MMSRPTCRLRKYREVRRNSRKADIIIFTVLQLTGLEMDMICTDTRRREIVEPRQVIHRLLRDYTKLSLKEISLLTGGRDHATVLHSCKAINTDSELFRKYKVMSDKLKLYQCACEQLNRDKHDRIKTDRDTYSP
jgi:chromosomal replication initiator protein